MIIGNLVNTVMILHYTVLDSSQSQQCIFDSSSEFYLARYLWHISWCWCRCRYRPFFIILCWFLKCIRRRNGRGVLISSHCSNNSEILNCYFNTVTACSDLVCILCMRSQHCSAVIRWSGWTLAVTFSWWHCHKNIFLIVIITYDCI